MAAWCGSPGHRGASVLALKSGIDIPSDLKAEVQPHRDRRNLRRVVAAQRRLPPLKNGDQLRWPTPRCRPTSTTCSARPTPHWRQYLTIEPQTVIDESYTAVAGLAFELSRLIKGSAELAIDARANLDPLVALDRPGRTVLTVIAPGCDRGPPGRAVGRSHRHQTHATRRRRRSHGPGVTGAGERANCSSGLQPTVPILLANLVSVGQVALTHHNDIEQPLAGAHAIAAEQAGILANLNTKQAYRGQYLSFNSTELYRRGAPPAFCRPSAFPRSRTT